MWSFIIMFGILTQLFFLLNFAEVKICLHSEIVFIWRHSSSSINQFGWSYKNFTVSALSLSACIQRLGEAALTAQAWVPRCTLEPWDVQGVPEKTLFCVQRPITNVWKQLLGQVGAVFKSSGYQVSFKPKKSMIM